MTQQYVNELTATYRPGIREIWLLGSRANGTATEASDWDYLVFLDDDRLFSALCQDLRFNRPGIDLLVVPKLGDVAMCPWTGDDGYTKTLGLGDRPNGIRWRLVSDTEATYMEPTDRKSDGPISMVTTFQSAKALRVHPPAP